MFKRVALVVAVVAMVLLVAETPSHARPGRGGPRRTGPPARTSPPSRNPRTTAPTPHVNPGAHAPTLAPGAGAPGHGSRPFHGSAPFHSPPALNGPTPPGGLLGPADRPSPGQLHDFINLPPHSGRAGPAFRGAAGAQPARNNPRLSPQQLQSVRAGLSTRLYRPQGPQPFTAAWYREHPNAWKITHPYAPAAAVAFVSLAGWVGVAGGQVVYDYTSYADVTNYYPAEEGYAEHQQEVARAAELAAADPTDDARGPWMTLGVFGLLSPGQSEAHVMLQLAVNQERIVRGTYFDVLTESTHPVRGSIDPETQQAAWTVGANPKIVYQTDLGNLTADSAPLLVHFSDRQTQKWTMVRIDQFPADPTAP